ncbi:hypothetical protein J6590_091705 [Homalodisca vitripennis]|nr:hypothetical protein J6590_091705 [Homalodisca vitripennis]
MQHAHFSEQTSNEETWEYYRQRQPNDKSRNHAVLRSGCNKRRIESYRRKGFTVGV